MLVPRRVGGYPGKTHILERETMGTRGVGVGAVLTLVDKGFDPGVV